MAQVNNVTRFLDTKKIDYQAFDLPAEKLSAVEAAEILNVSGNLVYKTIVVIREGKGKPILALVPGTREVDPKALAKVVKEKKLRIATQREAESITGLLVGGISPLALVNRGFQVVIDESVLDCDEIYISGGQRGLNIRLIPQNLIDLVHANLAAICQ
jgi:Cys-tRNA(Pro)/Cys-tRNA(Cys) deacylase